MLGDFITFIHNEVSISTVTGFINEHNSPASDFIGKKSEFLDYTGNGKSNLDRIYERYTVSEKEENEKNNQIELLKVGTELIVPKTQLNKEILSISGKNQFLEQADFPAFVGKSLLELLSDPLYTQKRFVGGFSSIFPQISVWIYVGALNQIINLSDYIISCSISVGKNGGNFDLTLPPVIRLGNKLSKDLYNSSNINEDKPFYFHQYIQNNDIIFIKFEQLELEESERSKDFILNKSVLSGQIYDFIGLVDTNSQTVNYPKNDVSISISGRDLIKLIIDDGAYFNPLSYIEDSEQNVFVNIQDDDRLLKRTFVSADGGGAYDYLYTHEMKSIASSMQFIINQLANLGIVDSDIDLFSSYGERRTKVYRLKNETEDELSEELHIGVWQIIKLLVDKNVSDRRIADSSSSQPDGSLIVQFQKLCQEPFVEFFADTYGDFYNFIVRQPPYTKSQILSFLNRVVSSDNELIDQKEGLPKKASTQLSSPVVDLIITIKKEDVINETLDFESTEIYSWYEIRPQGNFIGGNNNVSLAHVPILYFPQYANKWGCRRLSHISNYITNKAFTGKDTDINRDYTKEAIINDYKYMVDSFAYMPFTRRGSFTINGDRRIKRGTWIRYEKTGEIFYVDSVSNSFSKSEGSIDRTTTINVSRGMVEKYTRGSITYFNIADTKYIKQVLLERLQVRDSSNSSNNNFQAASQVKPKINIKSNFGVNQDVFDFFYQRKQFNV